MTTYTTVYVTPPWGVFSKVDCSTTKRVRHHRKIRLRKALGSRREVPNAGLLGTGTTSIYYNCCGHFDHGKSA